MESLTVVTSMMNNVIKSVHSTYAAADLLADTTTQIVKFFEAMRTEISELEAQAKFDKDRICQLEAEIEKLKKAQPIEPEVM